MQNERVFTLDASLFKGPLGFLKGAVEKALSLEQLDEVYAAIRDSGEEFLEAAQAAAFVRGPAVDLALVG